MSFVDYLVPIAVIAVAIVLAFGLINMMRGGDSNTSQKLMRARVLLQFCSGYCHHGRDLRNRPVVVDHFPDPERHGFM